MDNNLLDEKVVDKVLNDDTTDDETENVLVEINADSIKDLIYTIRGKQVMLDSDLAILYQVETRVLNQAVKRNIKRFPERFMFQLTELEYKTLISQIAISNKRGGRRKLPYAFTEQGISMLSAVLKSDRAIKISINIMDAFVEMRRFLVNNRDIFSRLSTLEIKQLETDQKFEKVFDYIAKTKEVSQKVFFNGQIYDAFSFLVDIVKQANKSITLIDNYVSVDTLNILAKKKDGVALDIYTTKKSNLTKNDRKKFNLQYQNLNVYYIDTFHDRFIILDKNTCYHIGASIKDAGAKSFAISRIKDEKNIADILFRIKN